MSGDRQLIYFYTCGDREYDIMTNTNIRELPPGHKQGAVPSSWPLRVMTLLIILATVLLAGIPPALTLMRRADAQVALGNAKTVRLSLQLASKEAYAASLPFWSASEAGGVTERVRDKVLKDTKTPGDFWVLQTDKDGYEVLMFLYQEGDFTVLYQKEPQSYQVFYNQSFIKTHYPQAGLGLSRQQAVPGQVFAGKINKWKGQGL